jgi:hypothetical protein
VIAEIDWVSVVERSAAEDCFLIDSESEYTGLSEWLFISYRVVSLSAVYK